MNDRLILVLIVINAVIIYASGFVEKGSELETTLDRVDNFFTLLFVIEAVGKMYFLSIKGYFSDRWNTFDFTLVMVAVPSMLLWLIDPEVLNLEFLLMFRVLRIFKFFRVIRFVPNINTLIAGFQRALKSGVAILITFFAATFIVSFLSYTFFRELSPDHFGNPMLAFYNTFKVFTIEGWFEVPDEMAEGASPAQAFFIRAYFGFLLFGGGIFGLAVINAVFVQSMLQDNYQEGDKGRKEIRKDIRELRELINVLKNQSKKE